MISKLLYNSDPFLIKHKWFSYLKLVHSRSQWSDSQKETLSKVMSDVFPHFLMNDGKVNHWKNVSWSKVAYELNKSTISSEEFKTDRQCKECWNNHLNPLLKKY